LTSLDQRIEKFEKILAGNPDDISVLMAYAEANLGRGKRLEALQAYQRVLEVKPDVVESHLAIVKIYCFQGLMQEAWQQLARVFQLSPDNLEGHVLYRKLSKDSPAPDELTGFFAGTDDFLPRPDALRDYRSQVQMEIDERRSELAQLESFLDESPEEPLLLYLQEMAKRRLHFAEAFMEEIGSWDERLKAMEEEKIQELERKRQREMEERRLLMLAEAAAAAAALLAEEPEPEPVPAEAKPAVSEERLRFFESIQDSISNLLAALAKTKGVTAVFVVDRDGTLVFRDMKDTVDEEIISAAVKDGVAILEQFRKDGSDFRPYLYWVLEFEKGIMVMRSISNDFSLLAVGQAGTNFGALRYSIDKNKVSLEEVLAPAANFPTQDSLLWETL
jgi:predicted regulator of Ras-like GTPase activity (Roadblock/LC7/MglB family)